MKIEVKEFKPEDFPEGSQFCYTGTPVAMIIVDGTISFICSSFEQAYDSAARMMKCRASWSDEK